MNTSLVERIEADADNWGPSGKFGNDGAHVKAAPPEAGQSLDDALELQAISIRLNKGLLRDLKHIAEWHGIGYQPMIRDLLSRFASSEILTILERQLADHRNSVKDEQPSTAPVENFLSRRTR